LRRAAKLIAIRKAEGKTHKEIAKEAGVTENAINKQNQRMNNGGGQKSTSNGQKSTSSRATKKPPTKPDPDNPDYEIEEGGKADCHPQSGGKDE
jgi:hypothetical protein